MPGCIVSATTANFSSVEKRRLRATPVITSTFENVSDIGTCLGLFLGPLGYRPCPVKTGCTPGPEQVMIWDHGHPRSPSWLKNAAGAKRFTPKEAPKNVGV